MLQKADREASVAEAMRKTRDRSAKTDRSSEMYQYVLLDQKLKDYGVVVTDDIVGSFLRQMYKDSRTGAFDYDALIQSVAQNTGIGEVDFVENVRHEIGVRHLMEVIGAASKFVTPREGEAEFRRENEQLISSAVFFGTDEFLSKVTLTPDKVATYYTNRIAKYRIPERTVLNYVRFDTAKHALEAQAEFTKQGAAITNAFEEQYRQKGPEAFRTKDDKVLTKQEAMATFLTDIRLKFELNFARVEAIGFYNELNKSGKTNNNRVTLDSFGKTAAGKGLSVMTTPPFAANDRVIGLEEVSQLAAKTATLTPEIPYTEPLLGEEFAIVPILKQKLPSEIPTLDSIRDRVSNDYRQEEALRLCWQVAEGFQAALTNGVDGKKRALADLATERTRTVVELPPVTLAMPTVDKLDPRIDAYSLKSRLFGLKKGESTWVKTRDGATVLVLSDRKPVDDAMVKASLNGYLAEMRKQRQYEAFQAWFDAEFNKSGLAQILQQSKRGADQ
jgi:hypothetical protein